MAIQLRLHLKLCVRCVVHWFLDSSANTAHGLAQNESLQPIGRSSICRIIRLKPLGGDMQILGCAPVETRVSLAEDGRVKRVTDVAVTSSSCKCFACCIVWLRRFMFYPEEKQRAGYWAAYLDLTMKNCKDGLEIAHCVHFFMFD
jgi:hypothetical protein